MSKQLKIKNFDPNGVGVHNGRFIGLPFEREEAQVILLQAPWDLTVSSGRGTHKGPANILSASYQLDLYDDFVQDAWKMGLFMEDECSELQELNESHSKIAEEYINALDAGEELSSTLLANREKIDTACQLMLDKLQAKCKHVLDADQLFGIIGGDHSVALAGIMAMSEKHSEFGILQIDAHMDLRKAYEGFTYSHASIFYNAMQIKEVKNLVQVGIRDFCEEEIQFANDQSKRLCFYSDTKIRESQFQGKQFDQVCNEIVSQLPQKVYISFDIDGLSPAYCPNTGTPVPGGLSFIEAKYLIKKVVLSGRQIVGFDLCEVAGSSHEYDGNVGARIAYYLSNYMGKSQGLI